VLFGSYDETLYALEAATGVEKWHFKTNGPFNGAPAVAEGYTFVAGCDSTVHVLDAKTGKEKTAVDLGSQSGATAAVAGDFLYAGTMGNDIQAIDWKKGTVAWRFQPEKRAQPFYASAAVTGDLVLAGSRDRKLYALNRKDGSEKWNFATRNRVECSPVVAGKRIYFGSLDENLYVLDLDGKKVEVIKLDGAVSGSPAAAEGRLLIGTQKGTLYCFGAKAK
jgi:outer membrane protein assembly factor BamB